ncbi:Hypothetical protein NTJ_03106 [Nesidiocoris tenuis]|uniref:Protein krueppel n=1 Tax=Nesidiocoris tenuis TaxID=355587 RepID=A0ABN7ADC6_9HEMI|nr:Hypothetical protein NTJ_03106 [Nesidiocoris tenuis]
MDPTQFLECGASSSSEPLDPLNVCRICANPDESLIDIFTNEGKDHRLAEKINKYLPISVLPTDILPTRTCYECTSTLLAFSDLYSSCLEAKKRLHSILYNQQSLDEPCKGKAKRSSSRGNPKGSISPGTKPTNATAPSVDKTIPLTERVQPIESQAQTEPLREGVILWDSDTDSEDGVFEGPVDEDAEEEEAEEGTVTIVPSEETGKKKKRKKKACISKCLICGKVFPFVQYLKTHLVSHSEYRPYQCDICKGNFKRKDHLNHHRRTVHMNHPEILQDLESRGLSHLSCEDCGAVRATHHQMLRHKRVHSPSLSCPICKEAFFQSLSLKEHMTKAHPDVEVTCTECGELVKSGNELFLHRQKHSARYICDVCGRSFALPATLKIHMALHTEERPHVCEQCGKAFKLKSRLQLHRKSHSDLRPYACATCPDKRFKTKTALVAHNNMHNDVRRYPCPHCSFRARKNSDLVNHIRTHTGEKPYKCSVCGRGFAQAGDMRKHQATHDRQKPDISK